jgi:CrcB protein
VNLALFLALSLAGGLGAAARFAADGAISARLHAALPLGTMTVNVIGSFALGLLVSLGSNHGWTPSVVTVVGTGFLGGFTTFSAATVEAARRLHEHRALRDLALPLVTLVAAVTAAAAGLALGTL